MSSNDKNEDNPIVVRQLTNDDLDIINSEIQRATTVKKPNIFSSFLNKNMDIGTFFIFSGVMATFGFGVGLAVVSRKGGGLKQTFRQAPPGAVKTAVGALAAGTALSVGLTTGLVYSLKHYYGIKTIADLGDKMTGRDRKPKFTIIESIKPIDEENPSEHSEPFGNESYIEIPSLNLRLNLEDYKAEQIVKDDEDNDVVQQHDKKK
ncbi:hypothetical protein CYY_009522 [Polysphondylium violaceum]|uniref:Transmembrane protein 242 n=1 Tax=Polysphondylium violaceum TaxID=133409 RepID=A0A8J4PK30_9MYCE|nr:hypothetical protein CYY_009522 [Polysphondylium violaceum]